jgi:hypothetical protein
MRSLLISVLLGAACLGSVALTPSTTQAAQRRARAYGYTYGTSPYSRGYYRSSYSQRYYYYPNRNYSYSYRYGYYSPRYNYYSGRVYYR